MTFLTPLFLAGLAALAIPVLLHLIQRERRNVVQFPSLMFIRRIPYQSVQRRRIRHWLLLAMRLAALTLLVLAFARPFFRSTDLAAASGAGAREVVVLLDRSYSMGYGDRWNQAVAAARTALAGLQPEDRGSVVLFGSSAEVALRSTADKSRLEAALSGVQPGASATRYGPALKLAGSILSESALPRKEVVLVSDFQRNGWQGAEGVRLPDGAVLTPVSLGGSGASNLSVTPVAVQRSLFSSQERATVTAGVVNRGTQPAANVPITLEIDGRGVQTQHVSVPAGASASTSFDPVTLPAGNTRAAVRIGDDALAPDNVFDFVLSPQPGVRVVIAERSGAAASSLYLTRALAVGEAPRFEVVTRSADALSAADLERASVVVLNDVAVGTSTIQRLTRFVQDGGGLFVAMGERGAWSGPTDLLPGAPGAAVDRMEGAAARLGALEYGHPVFEVFKAPRSGDFSAAHFYSYRAVTPAPGTRVLARFDDGGSALLEKTLGSGHVMLWTSSLDTDWNDLPLRPVYLPMINRALTYLAGYHEPPLWRTVGEVVEPPAVTRSGPSVTRVALTPSGQRVELDGEGPDVLELSEQGFYEIRMQGRDADPPVVVASNVDLTESDLTSIDPQEVAAAAMGHAGGAAASEAAVPPSDELQEGVQRLWWYLLFAALLLLAAETVVANRSAV
jgi:hypothetical protein